MRDVATVRACSNEPSRDRAQDFVTCRLSTRLVDEMKAVDVDVEQRDPFVGLRTIQCMLQTVRNEREARQPGRLIVRHTMCQLVLSTLSFENFHSEFRRVLPAFLVESQVAVGESDLRGERNGELFVLVVEALGTELVGKVNPPPQQRRGAGRDRCGKKRRDRRMKVG